MEKMSRCALYQPDKDPGNKPKLVGYFDVADDVQIITLPTGEYASRDIDGGFYIAAVHAVGCAVLPRTPARAIAGYELADEQLGGVRPIKLPEAEAIVRRLEKAGYAVVDAKLGATLGVSSE